MIGNAAEVYPELVRRGVKPDLVTDQTSAHDPLNGYVPKGSRPRRRRRAAPARPGRVREARARVDGRPGARDARDASTRAATCSTTATTCAPGAKLAGVEDAFEFPGFVPAYIRPLFCEGQGPFRWVALSGDPEDIRRTDRAVIELFPKKEALHRWLTMAQERVAFQGLPARICWLGYGEREKAGLLFNDLVSAAR